MNIKKIEEQYCIHRNMIIMGGLMGCADCGAGDGTDWANAKIPRRKPDPVVEKVNEIIEYLTSLESKE